MRLIPEVEFITVDKHAGAAARRALIEELRAHDFDLLMHLQLAFRASLVSRNVRARVRLGFDRARARELQWLFTNSEVAARAREHVLDSFLGFADALGVRERRIEWNLPIPPDALAYAADTIPEARRTLVISPCSSHAARNWRPERYAAIAEHAVRRHGLQVLLAGGPAAIERDMGAAIEAQAKVPLVNTIGRDTLPKLLAVLARAAAVVTPDSGPAHMATMVGTPVIGLYAATNPERSGPYLSRQWCVNAYPEAARRFRGRAPEDLPWTTKIENAGVMDLIAVEQVTAKLDELLAL